MTESDQVRVRTNIRMTNQTRFESGPKSVERSQTRFESGPKSIPRTRPDSDQKSDKIESTLNDIKKVQSEKADIGIFEEVENG